MYLVPGLGDDAIEPFGLDYIGRATYLAWVNDVAARGGLAVRLPDHGYSDSGAVIDLTPIAGVLGEKYPATVIAAQQLGNPLVWANGETFGYYVAPLKVRVLDAAHQAEDAIAIALGKAAGKAQDLTGDFLTGLIVTAAIAGGALILLSHLTSQRTRS